MRYLINIKTKEIHNLAPGVDWREIKAIMPDPDNWIYHVQERGILDVEEVYNTHVARERRRIERESKSTEQEILDRTYNRHKKLCKG